MTEEWRGWKHITKLDPDKPITPAAIKSIVDSGTDAVMISGTQNIKRENVQTLLELLRPYDIPKVLEPAGPAGMVYSGYDWLFVPTVFNTSDAKWINGLHKLWIKLHAKRINWDIVVPEAYIIQNPKCAAARVSKAKPLSTEDAVAAAICAERYFRFPIIYIEYSGTYGDPNLVRDVRAALTKAHLIYGGGIRTKEAAAEMAQWATIVVGNTIYEDGTGSFIETMRGRLLREMNEIQEKLHKLKKIKKETANNGSRNGQEGRPEISSRT